MNSSGQRQRSRRRFDLILALILSLLMVLIYPGLVSSESSDDDMDEVDDEEEDLNSRDVDVEIEDGEVTIESIFRVGEKKDVLKTRVRTDGDLRFEVTFKESENDSETIADLDLRFEELLEYEDLDKDGLFDPEVDDFIASIEFEDLIYDPIELDLRETIDGEVERIIRITTTDGMFGLVLHAVGDFARLESGLLAPTEVKFDILINDFPFEEDNTALALLFEVSSNQGTGEGLEEEDREILQMPGEIPSFLSWSTEVTVDGAARSIGSSVTTEPGEDHTDVIFSYPRGTTIIHEDVVKGILNDL